MLFLDYWKQWRLHGKLQKKTVALNNTMAPVVIFSCEVIRQNLSLIRPELQQILSWWNQWKSEGFITLRQSAWNYTNCQYSDVSSSSDGAISLVLNKWKKWNAVVVHVCWYKCISLSVSILLKFWDRLYQASYFCG